MASPEVDAKTYWERRAEMADGFLEELVTQMLAIAPPGVASNINELMNAWDSQINELDMEFADGIDKESIGDGKGSELPHLKHESRT